MVASLGKRSVPVLFIALLCLLFIFFPTNNLNRYTDVPSDLRLKDNRIRVVRNVTSPTGTVGLRVENVEFEAPAGSESRVDEKTSNGLPSFSGLSFAAGMPQTAIDLNTEVYSVVDRYTSSITLTGTQKEYLKLFLLSVVNVEGPVAPTRDPWKIVDVPPSLTMYAADPDALKNWTTSNSYGLPNQWTNPAKGPYQIININAWSSKPAAPNDPFVSKGVTNYYASTNWVTGVVAERFTRSANYVDFSDKYYTVAIMYAHHWLSGLFYGEGYQTAQNSDGADRAFAIRWAKFCAKPQYVDEMRQYVLTNKPKQFYTINNGAPAEVVSYFITRIANDARASDPNFFNGYGPLGWNPNSGAAFPTSFSNQTQGISTAVKIILSALIVEERYNGGW